MRDSLVTAKPRRVLLITPVFPPDANTAAARAGRFARYLPEFGYEVDVIAEGPLNQGKNGKTDGGTNGVWRVPRVAEGSMAPALFHLARFVRRMLPHDDQLPWAANVAGLGRRLAASRTYDAIVATAPPMGTLIAGLFLKKICGIPCLCDLRDPLLGNPFREPEPYFPHDALLEKWVCRTADGVICNTDTVVEQWRERYPRHAEKVSLIWNGFDPAETADPSPVQSSGQQTLAHVGALYGGRNPGALLASLIRLLENGRIRRQDVAVQLVGPLLEDCMARIGGLVEKLQALGCLEIDNRWVPKEEANKRWLAAGRTLVVDINEHGSTLQVPAKLFECIRLGKPVLALTYRASPAERILARAGIPHVCIDPRDPPEKIDEAVLSFLSIPACHTEPSQWFEETFDGRRHVGDLARILDSVLERIPDVSK